MDLAGRRVVVTGGAGFVGSHVVDRLVAIGTEVVVIDDLSTGRRDNLPATTAEDDPRASARPGMKRFTRESKHSGAVRLVVGDVRDTAVMDRELDGAAAVIHMACGNLRDSLGDPMRSHEINATGTLVACLAALRQGAERFLYVSSSEVYGTARFNPMTEEHPLVPTTVYAAAKAAGELSAMACMRTYGLPVSVVRLFNVYGPRANPVGSGAEVITRFVARILAGHPPVIFGDGSQSRDFTWIEDTAAGVVAAAECDALVSEGPVNLAGGEGVAVGDLCDLLLEILEAPHLVPELNEPRPGDIDHQWADTSKARELLGLEATVPLREGLERYVEWVRAEGSIDAAAPAAGPLRNW